jgi:hypothetical protein
MNGTWQVTGGGGSRLIGIGAVVVVVALAVEAAVHAVESVPWWVWVVGGVVVAGVLAGLVVFAVRMTRQYLPSKPAPWDAETLVIRKNVRDVEPARPVQALPAPQIHLNVDGATAEQVAAILSFYQGNPPRPEVQQ